MARFERRISFFNCLLMDSHLQKGDDMAIKTQKITPFLWFDDKAEEAMNSCVSIFKNSKRGRIRARMKDEGARMKDGR
jgi:hypothetical protein